MIEDLEAEDDLFKKVIAADAILDKILSALGYEGTFKDKFEIAQSRFKNSEAIWQAHKLRNKMTHEPEVMISEKTQILALRAYLKAFRQILK